MTDRAINSFARLGIRKEILRAIDELGFEQPSPIQARAIPPALAGHDVIGQAQTGTGKTAAFAIPILEQIRERHFQPQALVLVPTRELALQVTEEIRRLGRYTRIRSLSVYGGQPISKQIRTIGNGVDVVIGTPGRLLDHLDRGTLRLDQVGTVVLDEADEMLDMGFIDDIETILRSTPARRQTMLFSATMPKSVMHLARQFMRNPVHVNITPEQVAAPAIDQVYFEVRPYERFEALCRIIDSEAMKRAIIFCRTKRGVDELTDQLRERGYAADAIHGDLDQRQRNRVMQSFRRGDTELLIATDVAARGVDVEQITHVVNFDIPTDAESYVHRIGRTGRAGRSGTAMTLIHPKERRTLAAIERAVRVRLKRRRIPTDVDVAERQREVWRQRLIRTLEQDQLAAYRTIVEELSAGYDAVDVGAAALKLLAEGAGGTATPNTAQVRNFAVGRQRGERRVGMAAGMGESNRRSSTFVSAVQRD